MTAVDSDTEERRLATLRGYGILDTAREARFDEITSAVAAECATPIAIISLVDGDRQWFKASSGLNIIETPRSASFCSHAIVENGRPLVVPNTGLDDRFSDNPMVVGEPGIRAYAGAPLIAPDGSILGTVCALDTSPHEFTPHDIEALQAASRKVVEMLETRKEANLLSSTGAMPDDRLLGLVEHVPAIPTGSGFTNHSREIVAELLDQTLSAFGWWAAQAWWCDDGILSPEAWRIETDAPSSLRSIEKLPLRAPMHRPKSEYSTPRVMRAGDLPWLGDPMALAEAGVRTVVVFDVAGFSDFAVRLVFVVPHEASVTDDVVRALTTSALLMPKIIRQERARGELYYRATHDSLTGLLNRRGLEAEAGSDGISASSMLSAVVFIDLDKFKFVNDTWGHAVGDELLVQVARRLSSQVRPTDVLARLGGDEFVFVARHVAGEDEALAAARRLRNAVIGQFISVTGVEVQVSGSFGVALLPPNGSLTDALRLADARMYQAKSRGGGMVTGEPGDVALDTAAITLQQSTSTEALTTVTAAPILAVGDTTPWGYSISVNGAHSQPDAAVIARMVLDALPADEGLGTLVLELPPRWWRIDGLVRSLVDDLVGAPRVSAVSLVLDCLTSSERDQALAMELRQAHAAGLVLGNFGAGANELTLLERVSPHALLFAPETLLSLDGPAPKLTTVTSITAIARVLGLATIATSLTTPRQADVLRDMGCDLVSFVEEARTTPR